LPAIRTPSFDRIDAATYRTAPAPVGSRSPERDDSSSSRADRSFACHFGQQEERMQPRSRWTGWIAFAGWLLLVIGVLDFFEGLIAVIRGQYYVLTANQIIVFDLRTWGWITLVWGIVVAFAGWGVLSGATWARWFAIVVGSLNVLGQLGFVGGSQYPLWALTAVTLSIVVIYALIARWDEVQTTSGAVGA
jgi:hypothetical protein